MNDDLVARLRATARCEEGMIRACCEILLTAEDGFDFTVGPYLWVAMDGPDIRAMVDPDKASEIVLRKVGTDWQHVESGAFFEDVTIRAVQAHA